MCYTNLYNKHDSLRHRSINLINRINIEIYVLTHSGRAKIVISMVIMFLFFFVVVWIALVAVLYVLIMLIWSKKRNIQTLRLLVLTRKEPHLLLLNWLGQLCCPIIPKPPREKACSQKRGNIANVRSSRDKTRKKGDFLNFTLHFFPFNWVFKVRYLQKIFV